MVAHAQFPLLLLLTKCLLQVTCGFEVKYGQVVFRTKDEFACKSHSFGAPPNFSSNDVHIQLTVNNKDNLGPTYQAAVAWVETVSSNTFTACVRTSGPCCKSSSLGYREIVIPYLAYVGTPSYGVRGTAGIPLWTAGTECHLVPLSGRSFSGVPHVFATAVHVTTQNKYDAASVWVEDVTHVSFKLCLRELKNYDGEHEHIKVNWLALEGIPREWKAFMPVFSSIPMTNTEPLTKLTRYSFCKSLEFSSPFYEPPYVITGASHVTKGNHILPYNNAITEWVEEVTEKKLRVCAKDIQPYKGHHDPFTISFMTLGYLHPCLNIKCKFQSKCVAYGAQEARCECVSKCPSYEDLLCASDGKTYKNTCFYNLAICQTRGNITVSHNGSCVAFMLHRGRVVLQLDKTVVQCKAVSFKGAEFTLGSQVHVHTSVNYFNESGPFVHDAAVTWIERVSTAGFSVCALKAGRNDRLTPDSGLTFVDYIACQGAPTGSMAGEVNITQWWEGTTCKIVDIPKGRFSSAPHVLVSAEHMATGMRHDAATVWVEDVTASRFKLCLRELQDFDGLHKHIHVDWMAYEELPKSLLAERKTLTFRNTEPPLLRNHHAFCQEMAFNRNHTGVPTVIIAASHQTGLGKLEPNYNSIAAWVESRVVAVDNLAYNDSEDEDLDLDVTVDETSSKTEIIVEIFTGPKGRLGSLGFKIAGGKDKPCVPGDPGIFIQRVKQGSPVHGILSTGDKILKIDGLSVLNVHRHRALNLIKSADRKVQLVLRKTQKPEEKEAARSKQDVKVWFSPEQLEEYEAAFAAHDHGTSGKIYRRELKPLCRSLGHNITAIELEEIVTQLSLTDKRKIKFEDFINVMFKICEMENQRLEEDLEQAFEVFDRERKGFFKVNELLSALNHMPGSTRIPRNEIAEILRKSDADNDGVVQFKDFKKLVLPAFTLQYKT